MRKLGPLPVSTPDDEPFWASCQEGVLRLQRCATCGAFRYPPQPLCPSCTSDDAVWDAVAGSGEIHSFTVVPYAVHPVLEAAVPYTVVLVELDEGPRMVSNLVGVDPAEVAIGQRVRVTFASDEREFRLPVFALD